MSRLAVKLKQRRAFDSFPAVLHGAGHAGICSRIKFADQPVQMFCMKCCAVDHTTAVG